MAVDSTHSGVRARLDGDQNKPYIARALERQGLDSSILTPAGIFAGTLTHEFLGFAWLYASWGLCYKVQPGVQISNTLPSFGSSAMTRRWWRQGRAFSERFRSRPFVQRFQYRTKLDGIRFGTAGVESFVLRKVLWPITIPTKIYIAYSVAVLFAGTAVR